MKYQRINDKQLLRIVGGGLIQIGYDVIKDLWKHRQYYINGYNSSPFH